MAAWPSRAVCLAGAALWAGGLMAANTVPADAAENAAPSPPRAGWVRPAAADATMAALKVAVLEDALRSWPGATREQAAVQAEAVEWPDGSLGCPRQGQTYTQALVPGWRLVVRAPGRQATYHAARTGQWLLCPAGAGATRPRADEQTR